MKTNVLLQNKIGFRNSAQKVAYAAHVLKSALTNSPAIQVRAAVPAILAKPAVLAQTAKPARAASTAVPAAANTTGYAFGELYLNSPAYPIGTAIPAIPAKPESAEVVAVAAVVGVAASPAVLSPAVVAIKGWEDAIKITRSEKELNIVAELPVVEGVGIICESSAFIGELTPSTLQASEFLDINIYSLGQDNDRDKKINTLEQYLYTFALDCETTIVDTIRMVAGVAISCKKLTIKLYRSSGFVLESTSLQFDTVRMVPTVGS